MSLEIPLVDRICYECKTIIDAKHVFTETIYKNFELKTRRFFHEDCAKIYCKRQNLREVKK